MDPHLEQRLQAIEGRLDELERPKSGAAGLRLLPPPERTPKDARPVPRTRPVPRPPAGKATFVARTGPVPPAPREPREPVVHAIEPTPRPSQDFERFVGVAVLGRIGVGAVLLAAAYFARMWYDASAPLGRVLLLHGVGAAFFLVGWWARRRTIARYVGLLWGAGTALLWLAAAAAHLRFGIVGPEGGLALALATSVIATWHAHVLGSEWLGSVALAGAFGAVFLLPLPGDPRTFLTAYALILHAWGQMLDMKRGWHVARLVGGLGLLLLTASWILPGVEWSASTWWHLQAVAVALALPELVSFAAGGRLTRARGTVGALLVIAPQAALAIADAVHGHRVGANTEGLVFAVGALALGLAIARVRQARQGSLLFGLGLAALASALLPLGASLWVHRLDASLVARCHGALAILAGLSILPLWTKRWTRRGEGGATWAGALALLWIVTTPRGTHLGWNLLDFALVLVPGCVLMARAGRTMWCAFGAILFGIAAVVQPVVLGLASPWAAPWAFALAALVPLVILPRFARPGRGQELEALPAIVVSLLALPWLITLGIASRAAGAMPIFEPVTMSALVIALTGYLVRRRGLGTTTPGSTGRRLAEMAGLVAALVIVAAGHREVDAAARTLTPAWAAMARLGWYGVAMLAMALRGRRSDAPWLAPLIPVLAFACVLNAAIVATPIPWQPSTVLPAFLLAAALPLLAERILGRGNVVPDMRAGLLLLLILIWLGTGGARAIDAGPPFASARFLTGLVLVAALLVASLFDHRRAGRTAFRDVQAGLAVPLGWFVGLGEVLHLVAGQEPAWRAVAVSLYTTAWAASLLAAGFVLRVPTLRYCALGAFGVVILKVGLYDLRTTSLPLRVLVTGVLGVVLLVAAYGYARRKEDATTT